MAYPKHIYLGEEREEELVQYLNSELIRYYADTAEHIADLLQWQKDYWAKPTNKVTNFPFRNASTIVIPVTAIAVEAVHSRTETQLFGQAQIVVARSLTDQWDLVQKPTEDFMNKTLLEDMKLKSKIGSCFLDAEKFGTMVGRVDYNRLIRKGVRQNRKGEDESFDVVYKDGPEFYPIPEARFLLPYYAQDVQSAEWVGEEFSETPYAVEQMEYAGLFRPETIIGEEAKLAQYKDSYSLSQPAAGADGNKLERNQMDLEHDKFSQGKRIDWVAFWLAWEVDRTNEKKELIVHFHPESNTIMSIRYNYFSDLRRPHRTGVYFPIEHRWRGIGICKMNEQFQRSITVRHRQNMDNATLANIRMFKISKLSGYGNGEPIFPGKMWFLDSMDQLETIQMGEVYPSGYNIEQSDVIYSQQRTGVNEVTLGMPQVGTPGTATSDLARIQEGQKKFDLWYSNARTFTDEIIVDTADVVQQFGPRNLEYFDTAANGQLVRQFFQLPASYIREGLILELKTSSQTHNKILDRQNWQQIAAFLQQYYEGLIQMAMPMQNPQVMQVIFQKGLSAVTEAMRQILETYDVRNIDRIIVKELDQVVQDPAAWDNFFASEANGINGLSQGTGNQGTNGSNGSNRMAGLSKAFANVGGSGQKRVNRIEQS